MRILHIIPSYLPAVGATGPILAMHSLNKELVKNGVDVTVYTTNFDTKGILNVPINTGVMIDGVKVFYFPITFRLWQYSLDLHKSIRKNIKSYDLVHITSVFLSISTLGSFYAQKFKKPYIISPHGTLMKVPLAYHGIKKTIYNFLLEKRNLRKASALHFTSLLEKEEYLFSDLPKNRDVVIPNCFDGQLLEENELSTGFFRRKYNIKTNQKIILFLGRISWKKGFDTLVPAFAEVLKKEPIVLLVIAGPNEENYQKEVEKEIKNYKLKISENVIFTGMLAGEDKNAAYKGSDVFVLPSYSENFGVSVIEAMSAGLPTIITHGVGISGEVIKRNAGWVVPKDANSIAEAILDILANPLKAKNIAENAKLLVRDEFLAHTVVFKYIKMYEELIDDYHFN